MLSLPEKIERVTGQKLSTRIWNVLRLSNMRTLEDFARFPPAALFGLKGVGAATGGKLRLLQEPLREMYQKGWHNTPMEPFRKLFLEKIKDIKAASADVYYSQCSEILDNLYWGPPWDER